HSRLDHGHTDMLLRDLLAQRLRKSSHRPLRSVVTAVACLDLSSSYRRNIHYMATTLLLHDRQYLVTRKHHCQHVEIEHLPPLLGIHTLDLAQQHHASVVHQDINTSKDIFSTTDRLAQLAFVRHISNNRDSLATRILDPLHDLFQTLRTTSQHRYLRTLLCQRD